ncbi:MAG: squalene/phytoene synthase family protein, partial [Gammaproteobacteria bacterium]
MSAAEQFGLSGTDYHLAGLFSPSGQRDRVWTALALYRGLDDIFYGCSEPETARSSFAWWREALANTSDPSRVGMRTGHPTIDQIRSLGAAGSVPDFQPLLDGLESRLDYQIHDDQARQYSHSRSTMTPVAQWWLADSGSSEAVSDLTDLLARWHLIRGLLKLQASIERGHIPIPRELLIDADLAAPDLVTHPTARTCSTILSAVDALSGLDIPRAQSPAPVLSALLDGRVRALRKACSGTRPYS